MTDIILELVRIVLVGVLMAFFVLGPGRNVWRQAPGWSLILFGFGLLLVSSLVDVTDNFPQLNRFVILGNTQWQSFVEKIVGSLGGFLLLALGFRKWLPVVAEMKTTTVELERSRAALESAHDHLRSILNTLDEGVLALDAEGNVTEVNPAAESLLGLPSDQILDRQLTEVATLLTKSPDDDEPLPDHQRLLMAPKGLRRVSFHQLQPTSAGGPGLVVMRDITQQHEQEQRLAHNSKMESIGRLAGGIAHDFNNQLMGILGFAEVLAINAQSEDDKEAVTEILTAGERAAELTNQLLAFSRKEPVKMEPVEVGGLVDEVVAILQRSVDKKIEICQHRSGERTVVIGESSQLQSTFLNLALNACDAMPEGGKLSFCVSRIPAAQADEPARANASAPSEYVLVTVSDTGDGISPDIRKHIFEPFFTTKEPGKGTGLGLASVYGTIKQHGGGIDVHSEPGAGSVFSVKLPAADRDCLPAEFKWQSGRHRALREGRVLIVDDEESVQKVLVRILTLHGFEVVSCSHGAKGLQLFRGGGFDCVILDLVMPGMGGREVFWGLREIDPGIRIVICSGYPLNESVDDLMGPNTAYLRKPVRTADLLQQIDASRVLSEDSAPS